MKVVLHWYGRCADGVDVNYCDEHHGTVRGQTANECMAQIRELRFNHDISKYTPIEIKFIYDD